MSEIDLDDVIMSVQLGNIADVQAYLDSGLPRDICTETDRKTLLHCSMNRLTGTTPIPMVEFLLGLGLNVNAKDRCNWTPLHYAARSSAIVGAELLLNAGAEVDSEDDEGFTPLHRHLLKLPSSREMITLLLMHGANPDRKDGRVRRLIETCESPDRDWILKQFDARRQE